MSVLAGMVGMVGLVGMIGLAGQTDQTGQSPLADRASPSRGRTQSRRLADDRQSPVGSPADHSHSME